MSLEAKSSAGVAGPDDTGGSGRPDAGRDASEGAARDLAGVIFARLALAPALLAMAWLLSGMAFLAAGYFRPLPVTVLAVVLAVPLLWFGLRSIPGLPGRAATSARSSGRTPWWTLAAVAAIAVAFAAQQIVYHSQFVIITRDPGAYFQFANWLAGHGSLPVPANQAAFGGTQGGAVQFGGYATYPQGGSVVLQFMAGLPMVLAGAMWIGGYHVALLASPVLGTLAVVTFAGLAARLVGPRWAVLATLVVAVSLPMQFTSRSSYSEPLATILFLGGLALVLDGLRADRGAAPGRPGRGTRSAAALGGLALGITVLVRIDGASDILPVIPYCGALFVRRRPQAGWLAAGLTVGTAIGVAEGLVFSWPYLMTTNRSSVLPLAALAATVIVATVAGILFFRRRPLPTWWGWPARAALPAAWAVAVVFWVRPYVQQVRELDNSGTLVRTYAELSLRWVDWYLGIPVIVAATIGAGLLARRCLRGRGGDWALPLMVLAWAIVLFLYRPAISADQPWASRRMVPEVIPAFVLLAVWALARGADWLRAARLGDAGRVGGARLGGAGRLGGAVRAAVRLRRPLVAVCVLAVVLPAVIASWGLGLSFGNGVRLTADGLADKRDFQGELTAMEQLCAAVGGNAAVLSIEGQEFAQMGESIRSMCDVPQAQVVAQNDAGEPVMSQARLNEIVETFVAGAKRDAKVPVILAGSEKTLAPYRDTGAVRHVFTLNTTRDPNVIYGAPDFPEPQSFDVWMWRPSG
jgi:hypothetical protein